MSAAMLNALPVSRGRAWPLVVVLALVVLLVMPAGGCLNLKQADVTQFYILTEADTGDASVSPSEFHGLVYVAPVGLASYLDNPGIVVRRGTNEIEFSQEQQWAQPLRDNVTQVLRKDLAAELGNPHVYPLAHQRPRQDYIGVQVRLDEFDLEVTNQAVLVATWQLTDGNTGKVLHIQTTRATRAFADHHYGDAVRALSSTVGDLSREITSALRKLAKTPK